MIRLSKVYDELLPSASTTSMPVAPVSVPRPLISVILFFFIRKWTPLTMPALTCRDRLWVGPNDIVASPSITNFALSWVSVWARSAFLRGALEGIQHTFRQTPPQYFSSTTYTHRPSSPARIPAPTPPAQ